MKKSTIYVSIISALLLHSGLSIAATETESATNNGSSLESKSKEAVTDAWITTKVKEKFLQEKLFADKDINAFSIHVDTKDGVVHLSGTVVDKKQLDNAVAFAKKVRGVKKVETDVTVEPKK